MKPGHHETIYRKDYRPPTFRVDRIEVGIDLDPNETIVAARLYLVRQAPGPLSLDGEGLTLLSLAIDGDPRPSRAYRLSARGERQTLTIDDLPDSCRLDIAVRIAPARNTSLIGAVPVGRQLLHAMRGRGLPQDRLLPRPARRDGALHRDAACGSTRLSGAAVERQSRRVRRPAGRPALREVGRPVPEAELSVRARRRQAVVDRATRPHAERPAGAAAGLHRGARPAEGRLRARLARAGDEAGTSSASASSSTSTAS